jgi:hypothetical protein
VSISTSVTQITASPNATTGELSAIYEHSSKSEVTDKEFSFGPYVSSYRMK